MGGGRPDASPAAIETRPPGRRRRRAGFIEKQALFTRDGHATGCGRSRCGAWSPPAFTHRDSRAGDPDLHTHVAVANKVQTVPDGTLAARSTAGCCTRPSSPPRRPTTPPSKPHLHPTLGVRFAARAGDRPAASVRSARSSASTRGCCPRWSTRRRRHRDPRRPSWPPSSSATTAAHRPRWRRSRWPSRPPWKPATPSTNRAPWPSSGPPGGRKPCGVLGRRIDAIKAMIQRPLNPARAARTGARIGRGCDERRPRRILTRVEQRPLVWQIWHVRAEAQRQVRARRRCPPTSVDGCRRLARAARASPGMSIPLTPGTATASTEPAALRRSDGASVYTVAGASCTPRARILDAEAAPRRRRRPHRRPQPSPAAAVDLALLETAANGVEPQHRPGAAGARHGHLRCPRAAGHRPGRVRQDDRHAGARPRLERRRRHRDRARTLAVAAPGSATRSAATADTLAKLAWHLHHGNATPTGSTSIGPNTLVIIDEAGMADTLTLDAVVTHMRRRAAAASGSSATTSSSPRSAPAACCATSQASHGALRLTELVRFTDPAEGPHPSPCATATPPRSASTSTSTASTSATRPPWPTQVFSAWAADRAAGLDSVMLAPTRDLVAELNHRARSHRLAGTIPRRGASTSPTATTASRRRHRSSPAATTAGCASAPPTGSRTATAGRSRAISSGRALQAGTPQTGRHIALPADYVAEQRRARLRHHHPHRPGRHRRHLPRAAHRRRDPAAGLHDADPRRVQPTTSTSSSSATATRTA